MTTVTIINPTGKGIRSDPAGSGLYGAPRGNRRHRGLDLLCAPGQTVVAPLAGRIVRIARPYADDAHLSGLLIAGARMEIKLFYLQPHARLIGSDVRAGDAVGIAQDVTFRYPHQGMRPHIHMEVTACDPLLFLRLEP